MSLKSLKLIFIFLVILALVAGGYGLFIWFIVNIMKGGASFGLLFVAVIAGVASFFNPCSFPLLPAYLAQYYTTDELGKNANNKKKILFSGLVAAMGVTAFNVLLGTLIGLLGVGFGKSLGLAGGEPSSFVRWLRGILGGLLLVLGFSHATGRGINFDFLQRFFQKPRATHPQSPFGKIFSYGFGYTLLGIGCGGPILAGLSVYALSLGGFSQALLAFLVYSLVMALLMILVSTLVAFSKEGLLKDLGTSVVAIKKVSGILLLLVGAFLILSSVFVTEFTRILFPSTQDDTQVEVTTYSELRIAEEQAYWYSRYNLNALLLMSGMGERLEIPLEKRKALGEKLNFDVKNLPDNVYLLKTVYASGELYFQEQGDFADLATLYWDEETMDKTLDPTAHAMVIINAADERLRAKYHETPKDKFIGAVHINEALAMADTLEKRMKTQDGKYATRTPDGKVREPLARDQFLVLWAYANLADITSADSPFAYAQRPEQSEQLLSLAEEIYGQIDVNEVGNEKSFTRDAVIALEALTSYADISNDGSVTNKIRKLSDKLAGFTPSGPVATAFKVRGVGNAAAFLDDQNLLQEAEQTYKNELAPSWDDAKGVFITESQTFTPSDLAAYFGAVNTLRKNLAVTDSLRESADRQFRRLMESVIVSSGLQYSHAIPLAVNPAYQEKYSKAFFTAPEVPLSIDAGGKYGYGGCPMFQREIQLNVDS